MQVLEKDQFEELETNMKRSAYSLLSSGRFFVEVRETDKTPAPEKFFIATLIATCNYANGTFGIYVGVETPEVGVEIEDRRIEAAANAARSAGKRVIFIAKSDMARLATKRHAISVATRNQITTPRRGREDRGFAAGWGVGDDAELSNSEIEEIVVPDGHRFLNRGGAA
jgi:hypothetical protein